VITYADGDLCNTIKWFQVHQLVLNMEKTKIVKSPPENPLNFPLEITFGEKLPALTNAINRLGLQLDN
jgi:hypothetical protein